MEDIITNIKERVLAIAEYKGISKEKFFEQIKMSYGNFKGKSKETPLNSNAIAEILTIYPDVNPTWLLTGKGEMIVEKIVTEDKRCEQIQQLSLEDRKKIYDLIDLFIRDSKNRKSEN